MGSFKESGNIEFSAEVLIGMQDVTGDDTTEPRKISLKLLKVTFISDKQKLCSGSFVYPDEVRKVFKSK